MYLPVEIRIVNSRNLKKTEKLIMAGFGLLWLILSIIGFIVVTKFAANHEADVICFAATEGQYEDGYPVAFPGVKGMEAVDPKFNTQFTYLYILFSMGLLHAAVIFTGIFVKQVMRGH